MEEKVKIVDFVKALGVAIAHSPLRSASNCMRSLFLGVIMPFFWE